jgi:hypothetical protein
MGRRKRSPYEIQRNRELKERLQQELERGRAGIVIDTVPDPALPGSPQGYVGPSKNQTGPIESIVSVPM